MSTQPKVQKRQIASGRKARPVIRTSRNERSGGDKPNRRIIKAGGRSDVQDRFLKTVGIVLAVTVIISVATSIWFGWKIRTGLTDLNRETIIAGQLEEKYQALESERTGLMAKEMIEKKASVMGLGKPVPGQIVRP